MTILSTFHFGGKNCISVGKYVECRILFGQYIALCG